MDRTARMVSGRSIVTATASLRFKNVASVAIVFASSPLFTFQNLRRSELRAAGRRIVPQLLLPGGERFFGQDQSMLCPCQFPKTFLDLAVFQRHERDDDDASAGFHHA